MQHRAPLLRLTVTSNTDCVFLPLVSVSVYVTGGTCPLYPGAGVNVACPLGCITKVPVTVPVTGSLMATGFGPGLYTVLLPGKVKLVTVAVSPGGS